MVQNICFAILLSLALSFAAGQTALAQSSTPPKKLMPGWEALPSQTEFQVIVDSVSIPLLKAQAAIGKANGLIEGRSALSKSTSTGFTLGDRKYFIRNSGTEYVGIDVNNDHTLLLGLKTARGRPSDGVMRK